MPRKSHEPATSWLPSTEDVLMAPERAILAALDANLQLAIRSLRAEYPGLDENGRIIQDPDWEPYVPPQVPLIERLVISASDLHCQIGRFCTTLDFVLNGDETCDDSDPQPCSEGSGEDPDIPF